MLTHKNGCVYISTFISWNLVKSRLHTSGSTIKNLRNLLPQTLSLDKWLANGPVAGICGGVYVRVWVSGCTWAKNLWKLASKCEPKQGNRKIKFSALSQKLHIHPHTFAFSRIEIYFTKTKVLSRINCMNCLQVCL